MNLDELLLTEELKPSPLYLCGAMPKPCSKGTGTSGHHCVLQELYQLRPAANLL